MNAENAVNWDRIAGRMVDQMHRMLHEEGFHGPDAVRYAEALRRALGYAGAGQPGTGGRALDYEHLSNGQGLVTQAEADWIRGAHTFADRHNREAAEAKVQEMRAEVARVYREAAKDIAEMLRERCNERTVPSRYRREGVAWAADLIDPSVRKDRLGNVVEQSASVEAVSR